MYIFPSTGDLLCRIVNFFPLFCIMVSIYSMVTISFERRRAIVLSMDQNPMKIIKMVLPALWIGSFAVCIPTIIEYKEFTIFDNVLNQTEWRCGSIQSSTYSIINAFMLMFVAYIIPLVLVIINYIVIIRFLWETGEDTGATNQRRIVAKNRMKIIKMMVIAAALFAVSWAPYFAILAIESIESTLETSSGSLPHIFLTVVYYKNQFWFSITHLLDSQSSLLQKPVLVLYHTSFLQSIKSTTETSSGSLSHIYLTVDYCRNQFWFSITYLLDGSLLQKRVLVLCHTSS
ncbi:neuromedin-K receptor-like [Gigantopelta aegis]|uniref:neuromedin-K receptor-like n=1 Tax=Gigantopelta aegis TaxID=1735272 RepID=UPI001B88B45A|nr:neuromedin-K receptor-like [Gigantopelta aegis]